MQPWPGSAEGQEGKAQCVSTALGPLDGVAGTRAHNLKSGWGPWGSATRAGREESDPAAREGGPPQCLPSPAH